MSKQSTLTILFLTSSYPRNVTDNSSIFLHYLAEELAKEGATIHVLAPDHIAVDSQTINTNVTTTWFKYFPRPWQTLAYGSGILPNLKKNPLLYFQVPFFLISMFFKLFGLCRKIKPDVIHAHWIVPQGFIAVLVAKILNIPVVTTAHGGDAFSLNNGLLDVLKGFSIRHCNAWTSNTTATALAFGEKSTLPSPLIIPMGVNIKRFKSGNAMGIIASETRKVVLFVGRLVEKKGVRHLIDAFSKLPKNIQEESILWIVGDGEERESLTSQAQHLGISNIKFWGAVQNNQLPNIYASATVFVAPSVIDSKGDTEGQGVILLEAMASKTPIISTTVGGIPEVITHKETGLLVQPNNPTELSEAIQLIFNNEQLAAKLITNAQFKVANTYAWQSIAKQFISTYERVRH